MAKQSFILTHALVKELLEYDEQSGTFIWKVNPSRRTKIGDIAGSKTASGYHQIKILGKNYLAHRIAWLYVHGEFPDGFLDHMDHNPLNNRIENLRLATNQENKRNGSLYRNNSTGYRGVYESGRRFEGYLKVNGERVFIGMFDTAEEASVAVESIAMKIHADFYRNRNND